MSRYDIWDWIDVFFEGIVFGYGFVLLAAYAILAVLAWYAIRRYKRNASFSDIREDLTVSPLTPGISVLLPAYNEGRSIAAHVKSLLALDYPEYEIIIVNDGSTDDTLKKLIAEFELVQVDFAYNTRIATQPVRGVYQSTHRAYAKLLVVDKVNGRGKADAVNTAINAATYDYFVCTDVGCRLHADTLLELIKPVLQEPHKRTIAVGATLRLADSCSFDQDGALQMRPPRRWLLRFQEVEYIRLFLLARMGWSTLNSVPNVSGGLGLFDKEMAIRSGGYDRSSFAEDMDLTFRMCRFAKENAVDYAIRYVPKTLCWTEAPTGLGALKRQRTRRAMGLAQLIGAQFTMFFKPRYGRMGMIVLPNSFVLGFLAPIIEVAAVVAYALMAVFGVLNWPYAILLLAFIYTHVILFTTLAIVWDQLSFRYYRSWGDVWKLCLMPFFELFLYRPITVVFSLMGYLQMLGGKAGEPGNMQRKTFGGIK